jgi:hypothetical protein
VTTPDVPAWRRWGRRISFWALIGGILFLVLRIMQGYPVEVEVTFHYGKAGQGLSRALMVYRDLGGQELRRVRFNYTGKGARATQRHTVSLPRGEYRVIIDLVYHGKAPDSLSGRRVDDSSRSPRPPHPDHTVLRLERPLIVGGDGKVSVFVE